MTDFKSQTNRIMIIRGDGGVLQQVTCDFYSGLLIRSLCGSVMKVQYHNIRSIFHPFYTFKCNVFQRFSWMWVCQTMQACVRIWHIFLICFRIFWRKRKPVSARFLFVALRWWHFFRYRLMLTCLPIHSQQQKRRSYSWNAIICHLARPWTNQFASLCSQPILRDAGKNGSIRNEWCQNFRERPNTS